jgi:hypothetical protein
VYCKLSVDEVWLLNYLKTRLEIAFSLDEFLFSSEEFLKHIGENATFSRALVKIMENIFTSKLSRAIEAQDSGQQAAKQFEEDRPKEQATEDWAAEAPEDCAAEAPEDCAAEAARDCAVEAPEDCAAEAAWDCAAEAARDCAVEAPEDCAAEAAWDCAAEAPEDCAAEAPEDCPVEEAFLMEEPEPAVAEEEAPAEESRPAAKGLTLASLEGRMVEADGNVLDDDGIIIGRVIDGKPKLMAKKKATCDAFGEVIFGYTAMGKVELILPDGASEEPAEAEAETPPPLPIEDEPPMQEAGPTFADLEGRPIEKSGDILNENGDLIGRLVLGSASKLSKGGAKCDGKGNVVMKMKIQKDVIVELVLPEKIEEEPAPAEQANPMAKLEGLKIDKNGDILDANGDVVALLVAGSALKLSKAGASLDSEGKVWSKGKLVKEAEIQLVEYLFIAEDPPLPPEPEETALKELEKPLLSILEDRTVDADGMVYNDDNVPIGECVDGDISTIARRKYKIDAEGNVMSRLGKVLGKCVTLLEEKKAEDPFIEDLPIEEAEALLPPPPPTFAILEGRPIEKNGDILNLDGERVAILAVGSPLKLCKAGATCDAAGNVWAKGKKVTDAEVQLIEPAVEASPAVEEPLEFGPESVEENNACPEQVKHMRDGGTWETCWRCRKSILQMSIQLLRKETMSEDGDLVVV